MDVLNGLLYINDKDAYKEYGVFLCEERPGENKNYCELLKPAEAKELKAINYHERDGEKLPAKLVRALQARDVTLQFALVASNKTVFFTKYAAFISLLKQGQDGWLSLRLPELDKTYRVYYVSCTTWKQLTDFDGEVVARFTVKFREPEPAY